MYSQRKIIHKASVNVYSQLQTGIPTNIIIVCMTLTLLSFRLLVHEKLLIGHVSFMPTSPDQALCRVRVSEWVSEQSMRVISINADPDGPPCNHSILCWAELTKTTRPVAPRCVHSRVVNDWRTSPVWFLPLLWTVINIVVSFITQWCIERYIDRYAYLLHRHSSLF